MLFRSETNTIILNGDTLFKVNLSELAKLHVSQHAECTLALKPMHEFERYGVVTINNQNQITGFKEKQYYQSGFINGGVYTLNIPLFTQHPFPSVFSFEKDYLEAYYLNGLFWGYKSDEYFIDIGIPEDFAKAQHELI